MLNAVIITGQLRTFDKIFKSLIDSIIIPNNATVFLCCETDDHYTLHTLLNTFPNIKFGGVMVTSSFRNEEFNAILTMIKQSNRNGLSDKIFERARKADGINWHYNYVESSGTILQYYQFWKIWSVLLDYERTHNCKFDNVVRTRTDIFINKTINMNNVFEEGGYINELYINDTLVKTSVYYDDLINNIDKPDDTIITLGEEQVWIGKRTLFDRLAQIVFHYGLWDSGHSFSFNSETNFHEFCRYNNIYHVGIKEKQWPMFFYNSLEIHKYLFGIYRV